MTNVSLDTSEVRTPRKVAATAPPVAAAVVARPKRLLIAGGAGLGLAVLTGAGFGAYTVLAPAPVAKFASVPVPRGKIQFGPLADMPDIRDGVPALARSVPANLVERDGAALARRPAPDLAPSLELPNVRAASPPSTASLRPSVPATREASAAPVRIVATQPVPSASAAAPAVPVSPAPAPVVAALEASAPPVQVDAPAAALRRDPEPVGSIAPAPVRPVSPPAQAARSLPIEAPPLPPVRKVARGPEVAVPAQPNARQPSPAPRPVAAAVPVSAPVASRATAEAEERSEIFGVPLPRFVPTGRQIRDAASSVADAVTSIPDVF